VLKHKKADKKDGDVLDVIPGSAAGAAGISPDMKLIAVNGRNWSPELLREAIAAAKGSSQLIELLVEMPAPSKLSRLNYHEGERYPHLAREASGADLLTPILSRARAASETCSDATERRPSISTNDYIL